MVSYIRWIGTNYGDDLNEILFRQKLGIDQFVGQTTAAAIMGCHLINHTAIAQLGRQAEPAGCTPHSTRRYDGRAAVKVRYRCTKSGPTSPRRSSSIRARITRSGE